MLWISKFWSFWSALYNMLQTEDTELQLILSYRFSLSLLIGQLGLKCCFSNMHIHSHKWFLMVHDAFIKLGEKCIIYVSVLDTSWYCFSRYSHQVLVGRKTDWHACVPNSYERVSVCYIGLRVVPTVVSTPYRFYTSFHSRYINLLHINQKLVKPNLRIRLVW
jgi:hypothetical protein